MATELNLPPTFLYEKRGKIAVMTINRPEAMNAFTADMLRGMDAAFEDFNQDDDLWVAILTANGDRAFSSGMDLKEAIPMLQGGDEMGYEDHTKRPFSDVFKPIIAAVNGFCIAGGMEFMQGTDIRIATENATFGLGEVRWGIIPTGGSHIRLPRQIPWAVAMEMLLTGKQLSAQRAFDIGLINEIVPADKLMEAALKWAETICKNGALALESGFVLEKSMGARVLQSEDAKEGPRAFAEKRKPNFKGK
jgi:enoyl-CoA hydratase